MSPSPTPPRRRIDATLHVSADSLSDLAIHLLHLGTVLCDVSEEASRHEVPESQDRYDLTDGATSHLVATVDPCVTREAYEYALREWARSVLRTHVRADHREAALDPAEPF